MEETKLVKIWAVEAIWREEATDEQIALALKEGLVIQIKQGLGFQCTPKYYDLVQTWKTRPEQVLVKIK